ncbi:hypothetical protein TREES_T100011930 [Tupaia chinensis]|uniref:Uncharacterized protein n=1 Tax=Tupaia chinensis TaxID=246437 RepID=L9KT51_TUPCH|nr:hypothetical protein TREES_T100011930 [Tupaia chinensis]
MEAAFVVQWAKPRRKYPEGTLGVSASNPGYQEGGEERELQTQRDRDHDIWLQQQENSLSHTAEGQRATINTVRVSQGTRDPLVHHGSTLVTKGIALPVAAPVPPRPELSRSTGFRGSQPGAPGVAFLNGNTLPGSGDLDGSPCQSMRCSRTHPDRCGGDSLLACWWDANCKVNEVLDDGLSRHCYCAVRGVGAKGNVGERGGPGLRASLRSGVCLYGPESGLRVLAV